MIALLGYFATIGIDTLLLLLPVLLLGLLVDSLVKSLVIWNVLLVLIFLVESIVGEVVSFLVIYLLSISILLLAVIFQKRYSVKLKMGIKAENIAFWFVVIGLIYLSLMIPTTQNWDFYTFYMQPALSNIFQNTIGLFNNVSIIWIYLFRAIGISPRAVAVFFIFCYSYLLKKLAGPIGAVPLLLIPPFFVMIAYENLYLELTSFSLLALVLYTMSEYGFTNPYSIMSTFLLFFSKGNFAFVFDPILFVLISAVLIYNFIRFSKDKVELILTFTLVFVIIGYLFNNIVKYDALNFEVNWLFNLIGSYLPRGLGQFYVEIVSGQPNMLSFQTWPSIFQNIRNPIYYNDVAFVLLSLLLVRMNWKSKEVMSRALPKKVMALYAILIISYMVFLFYLGPVNTYLNIFQIRYYAPLTFLLYLSVTVFIRKARLSDLETVLAATGAILSATYVWLGLNAQLLMKENVLLFFNHINYAYSFTIFTSASLSFYLLVVKHEGLQSRFVKISSRTFVGAAFMLSAMLLFQSVAISWNLSGAYPNVNPDMSTYNAVLSNLSDGHYNQYFISYSENDLIISELGNRCSYIFSFGGIYDYEMFYNHTIFVRGGSFSYLPSMLGDLALHNQSSFDNLIQRYPFLRSFEFPSQFCLQVPTNEHAEGAFRTQIDQLASNSPFFAKLMSYANKGNLILATQYYFVYNIKISR